MPAPLPEFAETLLWCAAGLMLAYVFLPMLFMVLGQTRVTFAILGGPESAQPDDDDPKCAELYERLRQLGFEPLGSRREIGWFANGHWYKEYLPGCIWATRGRDCFVSLYRLFPDEPWRLAFSTAFADDSVVQTANQMTQLRINEPGYYRWACPATDLGEVLERHRQAVESFAASRNSEVAAPDLHKALECLCRKSQAHLRKRAPSLVPTTVQPPLLLLLIASGAVGSYFGFGNWTTAVALVLGGAVYKFLLPYLRKDSARRLREQDQERGLAYQWARSRQRAADARRASSDAVTPPRRSSRDK
jgi:hypothetical protein